MGSVYDFTVTSITGEPVALSDYRGRVLLIVNTASKCGFTPQYEGLDVLFRELEPRGLMVLGFPCNQFGGQEPGDSQEIASFCRLTYDVGFPLMEKIEVNGSGADPLFAWLKSQARGILGSQTIKWNFTKFLLDRNGQVKARFAPTTKPEALRKEIEALL